MKIKKLLIFFTLFSNSILYAQTIKWAQKVGGTGSDFVRNMATDNRGNTFLIGGFVGNVVLPGSGTAGARTLSSFGQTDIFLTKMDCNRNMIWKNSIGSSGHECGDYYFLGIKYDNKSNIYVTGTFSGTATFTTTSGSSQTITSNGNYDVFFAKYDTLGVLQWVLKSGGVDADEGCTVGIDNSGNVFIGGYFRSSAVFSTNVGSTQTVTSSGAQDIFVAKYLPSGALQWVRTAGGFGIDLASSIAFDNQNNLYVAGNFGHSGNSATFGSNTIGNSSNWGGYVAKLSSNGVWVWVNGMSGSADEGISSCIVDENCNVYTAGHFGLGNTSFSSLLPGSSVSLINNGDYDLCVSSYDSSGVIRWAKNMGSSSTEYGLDIILNKANNLTVSGTFSSTANFGNSVSLTSNGAKDGYVCQLNPANGNAISAVKVGGSGDDYCYKTIPDNVGNMFSCGFFSNTASFGSTSLVTNGNEDAFFMKFAPTTIIPLKPLNLNLCSEDSAILIPKDSLSGLTFQWYRNNTIIAGANRLSYAAKLAGTYFLKVANSCNEQDSSELITLTISTIQVNAGIDQTICQRDSVQLLASGASTYFWSPASGISNRNIANPWAKPTDTTNYILRGISNTCISYDTVRINVKQVLSNAGLDSTICFGDSIRLSASAIGSYKWLNNLSIFDTLALNTLVKPLTTQTYILTSNNLGCSVNDSVRVTVNQPQAFAGIDRTICLGDSVQLSGSGTGLLKWSPNYFLTDSNQLNTFAKPPLNNNYILKATIGRCVKADTMLLTVNQVFANAGNNISICKGDSVLLSGTALGNFAWQKKAGIIDTNVLSTYVKPITTSSFVLQSTNGTCLKTDTVLVTVFSPTSNANSNQNICLGDSVQLNGIANGNYSWYPRIGLADSSALNTYAKPIITTNYVLLAKDSFCVARDTVTINVTQVLANAGLDKGICPGDSAQLNGLAIGLFSWQSVPSISSTVVLNPYVKPINTTNYILIASSGTCVKYDTVQITVSLPLNLNAGADTSLCVGDSIRLNATGGFNYYWYKNLFITDTTISNPFVKPNISSNFIVKSGFVNCLYYDTVNITVRSLPSVDAGLNNQICIGDSIQLQGSGAGNITWKPNVNISNNNILNPYVKPVVSTKYFLTIKDLYCANTDSTIISVNNKTPINAGLDAKICNGDTINLNVNGANEVRWINPIFLNDSTVTNPKAFPTNSTTFVVKSFNVNCPTYDSILVEVNDKPIVNAGRDTIICKGFPYQLNGKVQFGDIYNWTPSSNLVVSNILNPTFNLVKTGYYTLNAENNIGNCKALDSVFVQVDSVIAVFNTNVTDGVAPLSVVFNNNSINANTYLWTFENNNTSNQKSPTYIFNDIGEYKVVLLAINDNGCEDTAMITIYVDDDIKFQIPNVFTPNGDSLNDYFENKISNYKMLKFLKGTIWNRWGQQIYEYQMPNGKWWDGSYEGQQCVDGVYFYIIEAETIRGKKYSFHGTVTVLR